MLRRQNHDRGTGVLNVKFKFHEETRECQEAFYCHIAHSTSQQYQKNSEQIRKSVLMSNDNVEMLDANKEGRYFETFLFVIISQSFKTEEIL